MPRLQNLVINYIYAIFENPFQGVRFSSLSCYMCLIFGFPTILCRFCKMIQGLMNVSLTVSFWNKAININTEVGRWIRYKTFNSTCMMFVKKFSLQVSCCSLVLVYKMRGILICVLLLVVVVVVLESFLFEYREDSGGRKNNNNDKTST